MNKLIINNYQLKTLISKICRDVANSGWRPDYIVGITRGGLVPAVMISHYFNIPCETLNVSLRDGGEPESNLWMAEDAFNGKNILIVDDINDQGSTLNWIMQDWPSGCMPHDQKWKSVWGNNVRFAVVVDNLSSKCNMCMSYWGMEINKAEKDVWVDFPYEDWWSK
jgi:hypoxanthine phosphoribosyltransferase